jgi:hypothetical protein
MSANILCFFMSHARRKDMPSTIAGDAGFFFLVGIIKDTTCALRLEGDKNIKIKKRLKWREGRSDQKDKWIFRYERGNDGV